MTPIEQVVDWFLHGRKVVSSHQLSGGLINQTFQVELDDGEIVIAQKINTAVFSDPESIHQNIGVVEQHLKARGYRYDFPIPVQAVDESTFVDIGNGTWRVLPFIPNSYSVGKASSSEMAFNAGKCLGHFHSCLQDFDSSQLAINIPDFHSGMLRVNQFEEAKKSPQESRISLVDDLSEHLDTLQKWDEVCAKTPRHAVHFDTKIENFLFKNGTDEVAALIDLDTIMPGCRLSDVGDLIRSFCDHTLTLREPLLRGYLSEMNSNLTKDEKQSLRFSGAALALMQSVRFLTDHLMGDHYYQIAYQGQNLERASSQFALFQQLIS